MATVAKRVEKHRTNLRNKGMRPIQIWVPDIKKPGFTEECKRQSALVKNDPQEKEILEFLEEVACHDGWIA